MRRVVPTIVLTLIGLAALASFRSIKPAAAHGRSALGAPKTATTTPATAPPATAPPPDALGPTPAQNMPTTPPTTAPPANSTQTVDGDPFDNRFGTVQVRVTKQGGKITDITALQMPYDHPRSQYISQQAEPMLQQEALQAQSAQIDLISGATYTSDSYAQSLQSALDKIHG